MVKRILSSTSSELLNYDKLELLKSIKLSEGRTIVSEVIGEESLFRDLSNAEVAAAFGADIQHIGDAGYGGIALPENILTLSKTIRGKRHSYRRMSLSINR